MPQQFQSVRGMPDIQPNERAIFERVFAAFQRTSKQWGFEQIETPIVEERALFTRAIGEATDIVTKEMFSVGRAAGSDEDKHDWVLRPEATASIVRVYIQHGLHTWPQPVKLSYIGPMFRYERPQAGRLRQFWQAGIELLGEQDASADALVIAVAWQTLEQLQIKEPLVVSVNSVGDKKCRPKIRRQLTLHFQKHVNELCADCKERLKKNPLRILDCKEAGCQRAIESAPELVDLLCPECTAHFRATLEYLDEMEIPYQLTPRLVRGLDYYTRTVFEIGLASDTARQSSFLGGGRYDLLVEEYGGRPTPATGFAMGIERIVEVLQKQKINVRSKSDVFLVQLGEQAKRAALKLARTLTAANVNVAFSLSKGSLKAQLRQADRARTPIAIIIGQREVFDKTAIIRRMDDGGQETVPQDAIADIILRTKNSSNK